MEKISAAGVAIIACVILTIYDFMVYDYPKVLKILFLHWTCGFGIIYFFWKISEPD